MQCLKRISGNVPKVPFNWRFFWCFPATPPKKILKIRSYLSSSRRMFFSIIIGCNISWPPTTYWELWETLGTEWWRLLVLDLNSCSQCASRLGLQHADVTLKTELEFQSSEWSPYKKEGWLNKLTFVPLSIHSFIPLVSRLFYNQFRAHKPCCRNRTDEAAWRSGVRFLSTWILAPKVLISLRLCFLVCKMGIVIPTIQVWPKDEKFF